MTASQPTAGSGTTWRALLAQYDMVQAASKFAWEALLDAYKPSWDGRVDPQPELIERYKQASALLRAAERALLTFMECVSGPPSDP